MISTPTPASPPLLPSPMQHLYPGGGYLGSPRPLPLRPACLSGTLGPEARLPFRCSCPLRIHSPQPGSALPGSGSALPGSGSGSRSSRAAPAAPGPSPSVPPRSLPPPPTCYSPPELHPHWPSPPAPPYPSSGWSVSLEGRGRSPQGIGPGVAGRGWGAGSRGPAGGGAPRAGRQGATGGHFGGVMVGRVWPPPPGSRSCPPGHLLALAGKQPSVSAVLDGNLCLDRFLPFT